MAETTDLYPKNHGVECFPEKILGEILQKMDFEGKVKSEEGEDCTLLTVQCEDSPALLIGEEGETLDAIQHIVNKIVWRKGGMKRVIVDAEGYRERRKSAIEKEAREAVDVVKETKKEIVLRPMHPSDRRIVHLLIANEEGLQSNSSGDGLYKSVVISPLTSTLPGP